MRRVIRLHCQLLFETGEDYYLQHYTPCGTPRVVVVPRPAIVAETRHGRIIDLYTTRWRIARRRSSVQHEAVQCTM